MDREEGPGGEWEAGGEEGVSLSPPRTAEESVLQERRENPLDLNAATEEELKSLPGMDWPLARRIVEERRRRGGFSSFDEVEGLPGMSPEARQSLRALARVSPPRDRDVSWAGDVRWRTRNVNPRGSALVESPPAFQNNTYFYNRTRFSFGRRVQAGWLAKRGASGGALTFEDVRETGVFKYSARLADAGGWDNVIGGHYTLSYGQGLLFYDALGEFARPVKVKERGARQDYTSGNNEYLRGMVLEDRVGPWGMGVFVSQKSLSAPLNPDGSVDMDLNDLRRSLGEVQDEEGFENADAVSERIYGARLSCRGKRAAVGATAYQARYGRMINPADTSYRFSHAFRGNENSLGSLDFDVFHGPMNLYGEVARSRARGLGRRSAGGSAWTVTPLFDMPHGAFWFSFFEYGADFFSRHGKGTSFSVVGAPEDLTDNQRGMQTGLDYGGRRFKTRAVYTTASFPRSLGDGGGSAPIQASHGRRIYFESLCPMSSSMDFYFRYQEQEQEVFPEVPFPRPRRQVLREVRRFRYQLSWRAAPSLRWVARYETRREDTPGLGEKAFGHLLMGGARWEATPALALNARLYVFDSPEADLNTGVEEIWNRTTYHRLAGNMNSLQGTPGSRFCLTIRQKVGGDTEAWLKFDVNSRPADLDGGPGSLAEGERRAFGAVRHGFHLQLDHRWGHARAAGRGERSLSDE